MQAALHKANVGSRWEYAISFDSLDWRGATIAVNPGPLFTASQHYLADTHLASRGLRRVSEWQADPWGYDYATVEVGAWTPDIKGYGFITASI